MALNKSKDIKELKKFDVDLEFGQQWEKHIDEMFSGAKKCEVKTERDKWASTGNICIETESYGKPSGLTSTEAELCPPPPNCLAISLTFTNGCFDRRLIRVSPGSNSSKRQATSTGSIALI